MRGITIVLASVLIPFASADPLGTRPSPAAFDASPVGAGPVVQLLLALALVGAGIKWALPAIVKRFGGRISTEIGGTIRIEESAAFPGGRLYVVEARGRTLLLGTTAQSVACLADLTVTDFAEALATVEAPSKSVDPYDPQAQLARLERLAG
jgi:flagellar biogenesis protein FliO